MDELPIGPYYTKESYLLYNTIPHVKVVNVVKIQSYEKCSDCQNNNKINSFTKLDIF